MEQTPDARSRKASGTTDTEQNLPRPENRRESEEQKEREASRNLLAEVDDYRQPLVALSDLSGQQQRLASLGFPKLDLIEGTRRGLDVGAPPESQAGDRGVVVRGRQVSLRTENGQTTFSDERGQKWVRRGDTNTWTRSGSEGRDNWHGTVEQDANGNIVRRDSNYGVVTTYGTDGSQTRGFRTREGKDVSIRENADGSRVYTNGSETWQSRDGRTWTNGDQTRPGSISIDRYGRLHTRDANDRWQMSDKSAETQEIHERITELQRRHNIRIGYPGETITHGDPGQEQKVELRLPTRDELNVIDEGLQKYSHLARRRPDGSHDFQGLKFGFVSGQGNGARVSEHGWYDPERREIFFGPRDSATTRGFDGMEGTFIHEVAHHLQNLNWPRQRNGEDVPEDIRRFFGFRSVRPGEQYRLTDRDGKLWQLDTIRRPGERTPEDAWLPVENGRVVRDARRARTNQEMRDSLPDDRRTASDYFDFPHEAHAEAQAMLLMHPERLMNINPNLYRRMREWDQRDIDRSYGTRVGASGVQEPTMIRDTSGHIVPNTPEARARIAADEQRWRDNPRPDMDRPRTMPQSRCACCVRRRAG